MHFLPTLIMKHMAIKPPNVSWRESISSNNLHFFFHFIAEHWKYMMELYSMKLILPNIIQESFMLCLGLSTVLLKAKTTLKNIIIN